MSKLVKKTDGTHTLYIHRDELISPLSENAADVEADRQRKLTPCDVTGKHYAANCENCKRRIILHCPECKQQITGCSCTLAAKVDAIKEEAYRNLFG